MRSTETPDEIAELRAEIKALRERVQFLETRPVERVTEIHHHYPTPQPLPMPAWPVQPFWNPPVWYGTCSAVGAGEGGMLINAAH